LRVHAHVLGIRAPRHLTPPLERSLGGDAVGIDAPDDRAGRQVVLGQHVGEELAEPVLAVDVGGGDVLDRRRLQGEGGAGVLDLGLFARKLALSPPS
jgi:hypothetical protein